MPKRKVTKRNGTRNDPSAKASRAGNFKLFFQHKPTRTKAEQLAVRTISGLLPAWLDSGFEEKRV